MIQTAVGDQRNAVCTAGRKDKATTLLQPDPSWLKCYCYHCYQWSLSAIYLEITYDMQALSLQTYIVIHVQYVKL